MNIYEYMELHDNVYTRNYVINELHKSTQGLGGRGGGDLKPSFHVDH